MQVAIIGAGLAGLVTAKVLRQNGFEVTVLDRTPDVGGVWSTTRRYPGLRTQNSKHTYCFSDHPMPEHFPDVLDAAQMQTYLAGYVDRFGFGDRIRLNADVVRAELTGTAWMLTVRDTLSDARERIECDHLVIANGIFSDPAIPTFAGSDAFAAAGGRICAPSQLHALSEVGDKHIVVVGYGKSACDIAEAVSDVAASTTVVARRLIWKMPRHVRGIGDAEDLMCSRFGEAGFGYIEPTRFERFYNGRGRRIRDGVFDLLQWRITRQLGLRQLGLEPDGGFAQIARSTASLVTEGFYEKVSTGRIVVHRDSGIAQLYGGSRTAAHISDGARVPADIIVCATGFHQRVPFLDKHLHNRITDDRGNFRLYRHIMPVDVPALSFAGYNSSLISTLNAEIGALWTAALLTGRIRLPAPAELRASIDTRLQWMHRRTDGHHARGTAIIPFSIHNIDELLADLNIGPGRFTRARQWLRPIRPRQYREHIERALHEDRTERA